MELLPVNEYSRPGLALKKVRGIVVHYTANPGTTAIQNRNYFAGLEQSHQTKASSHFVIGLDGEIVQCIPCNEIAYASNNRNSDTIAIECCIPDDTGKFNDSTYQSLIELTTWLIGRYDLGIEDVIRHYDVTGKTVRNILWNMRVHGKIFMMIWRLTSKKWSRQRIKIIYNKLNIGSILNN